MFKRSTVRTICIVVVAAMVVMLISATVMSLMGM